MRVLSATEAVAPAFKRTWAFYFKPFRIGRSWKWAASAYVGQLGLFFLPLPLPILLAVLAKAHVKPWIWVGLSFASIAFIALGFWLFYLCTRMEIVFFEAVMTRVPFVRTIWGKYRTQAWQMVGARLVLSAVLGVFVAFPLVGYLHNMIRVFANMPKPGMRPDPAVQAMIFRNIFSSEMVLFGVIGVVMLISSLLSDFMLPTLALEGETMGEAISRMLRLFRTEPLSMLAYVFLKGLLALIGFIAQYVAYMLAVILSLIPIGIVAAIVGGLSWLALHSAGILGHVVLICELVVAYLVFLGWSVYVAIGAMGIMLTFLQYFALYFLGGRYPALGNLLEPPVVAAPPAFEPPLPEPIA